MSDDDGTRRPGRPAPRFGEYASSSSSGASSDGSGLSEADARIVAEAAEYRRAQAERDAPAAPVGRGAKKPAKAAAPQTLAEQMAEERKAARERMLAERREAEKAAEAARREARRTPSAKTPAPAREERDGTPASGATRDAPGRPGYLPDQAPRRAPWRFDAAITIGLLAAGLVNVVGSIGANADPSRAINQSYALFGGGTYTATAQTSVIGIAVNVVNVVVFVLAAWIALELVKRKRIAFWVPIAGAVLATVITSLLVLSLIVADPAFQQIMSSRGP
ncbi:hypothetical protein BFL36_01790 [Clavibacter michiganensis]|uniref:Uncharacterized protein n=1 Tax=Clavibacter michiganensis TaxID=28447 RepID=A0A251YVZ5_9MICO|nr:DUF6264 family protein [Clavibacter michiganensis]OUE28339.1 hypothetical protein BFL36_01790 [Clavibacter michiganensis]